MNEHFPRITDEQLVAREIQDAIFEDREISDTCARIIASWWHGGQASALYSFVSTGAIDRKRLMDELGQEYVVKLDHSDFDYLCLFRLIRYVTLAEDTDEDGNRGPVDRWHEATKWGEPS